MILSNIFKRKRMNKQGIEVLVKIENGVELPIYQSDFASGLDVRMHMNHIPIYELEKRCGENSHIQVNKAGKRALILGAGDRYLCPTGIRVAIPQGYEIQVRPRSGLALKTGINVNNTPGTIDADYRGEIGVILIHHGKETLRIYDGERIAQLVLQEVEKINWKVVEGELPTTVRGEGGFNSTGTK